MTEQAEQAEDPEVAAARARWVAERVWALDRPEPEPSRADRLRMRLRLPWRRRAVPVRWRPVARRRRWWEWLGAGLAVAALVGLTLVGWAREWGWLPSVFGTKETAAAEQVVPGTLAHPFAGSPARDWANGARGIELPDAKPVGAASRADIAQGMLLAKMFLVAANLDRDVLNGGSPERALAMLGPDAATGDRSPLALVTRFDTDDVRLVGDTVKVRGRMTVEEGLEPGVVDVRADYTFVYPVVSRNGPDEVARTVVRRVLVVPVTPWGEGKAPKPGKLSLLFHKVSYANGGCSPDDGLLHPSVPAPRLDLPDGNRPPLDPYIRTLPLPPGGIEAECRAVVAV